jgi:hypothetical protein
MMPGASGRETLRVHLLTYGAAIVAGCEPGLIGA